MKIIGYGNAKCIRNPHGRSNLHCYALNQTYPFKLLHNNGGKFYQLKSSDKGNWEDCPIGAFKTFFKQKTGLDEYGEEIG